MYDLRTCYVDALLPFAHGHQAAQVQWNVSLASD